jgi:hypothetical protein
LRTASHRGQVLTLLLSSNLPHGPVSFPPSHTSSPDQPNKVTCLVRIIPFSSLSSFTYCTRCRPTRSCGNVSTMAMTRMTPRKAKVIPSLEDNIHLPISSNKLQAVADSSSVQVVVRWAWRLLIQLPWPGLAAAVGPHFLSQSSRSLYYVVTAVRCIVTYCACNFFTLQRSK